MLRGKSVTGNHGKQNGTKSPRQGTKNMIEIVPKQRKTNVCPAANALKQRGLQNQRIFQAVSLCPVSWLANPATTQHEPNLLPMAAHPAETADER